MFFLVSSLCASVSVSSFMVFLPLQRKKEVGMQKETKLANKTQISLKCRLSVEGAQWGFLARVFLRSIVLDILYHLTSSLPSMKELLK